MPQDQAVAACFDTFRKKNQSEELFIEHFVPITSSAELDGDFMIEGIAINETTTSNGHKFIGEELRLSANTLKGVPLLKDHNNSVDSIVGKVKFASFDEIQKNIPFKAVVKDPKIKELIKDGLLNTVSVGAHVDPANIEELENGDIVPHGITFKELSVVAVPADSGATFGIALNNAYKLFKSNSNENLQSTERRNDKNMNEKEISKDTNTPKVKEEKDVSEKILELLSNMDKRLEKLESSDADEPKVEEPKVEEPKEDKEEKADETEEEEEEEEESEEIEEMGDYKLTQGYNSFGIVRKSYNY